MRRLGLIGGLGPGATVHYYQELVRCGAGEMLFIHAAMDRVLGDVARGDRTGLAAYFAKLIERLADGGAEVAAISAITPHFCIRELQPISVLPLVNIVEAVGIETRARGYRKVALFGTRFVVESRMFGMLEDFGIEVVTPEREQIQAVHTAYMQVVEGGLQARATLTAIARTLPVDAIVLAGTDLSAVFTEETAEFSCIDGSAAHIRAIVRTIHQPEVRSAGTDVA